MHPIDKKAALGLSHAPSATDREERSAPAAFGRPTLHLHAQTHVRRRTTHKYLRPQLDGQQSDELVRQALELVTMTHTDGVTYRQAGALQRARFFVMDRLAVELGPHQAAVLSKHPHYEKAAARIEAQLLELDELPSGFAGAE